MLTIGWREWISLPELGISAIKAKIDTGARTSALHAFKIEYLQIDHQQKVKFSIHPFQYKRRKMEVVECLADLKEMRHVTDSGGHQEERPVIETMLKIGDLLQLVEITLTCRDEMRFKMLLGRTAMRHRLLVNPAASYLLGKKYKL